MGSGWRNAGSSVYSQENNWMMIRNGRVGVFGWMQMCRVRRLYKHMLVVVALVVLLPAGCGKSSEPAQESRATSGEIEPPQAAERYDLARDENRGGHTLSRHLGRTDAELRERLAREPNISAASTWTDRDTAEVTIAEALRAERGRIDNWLRRGTPRTNLALQYNAGRAIGRSLRRGDGHTVDCTRAVIVLRADGPNSFYVLTSYPEANR
jgi:hypothetical protein